MTAGTDVGKETDRGTIIRRVERQCRGCRIEDGEGVDLNLDLSGARLWTCEGTDKRTVRRSD